MQTKLEKAKEQAEINKMNAEADKLRAEARKIHVEADKMEKDLKYYFITALSLISGAIFAIYKIIKELM
ncbi:hypothetical protein QG053_10560 [Kingella kingae]|uniref:hypothetical protein n=1 Tax=Kingella kingae TaxID=504 RepID=UPI00254D8B08|nr:hypothetical protein [Kingella kingae]MDK4565466.1 hypothetical protein [Kingella kingae]